MALFKCQGQILKSISIAGSNKVGSILSATTEPVSELITYQWYRDNETIPNAANTTYTITGFDVDKQIHCVATLYGHPVDSNWLEKVPTPTCSISGSSVVGSELTCSIGNTLSEVTYQWYRGNTAISNANKKKYTITNSDVGYKIKCSINTSGFGVTSNESGVVDYNWIGPISEEKKDPNNGDYRNTASVSWSFNPGIRLISVYSEGASSHEEYGRAKIYISTSDGRYNNTLVRESEPMNTAWTSWDDDLENVTYVRCEIDGTVNKKNCTGQIKYYKKG